MLSTQARFLIADDMKGVRILLTKQLKALGYTDVVEAESGSQAWNLLEQAKQEGRIFDIIISDIHMPNGDGLELLAKVKGHSGFKSIPFMMLTAESEQKSVSEALRLGVTDYIMKPVSPPVLKQKLEKLSSSNQTATVPA